MSSSSLTSGCSLSPYERLARAEFGDRAEHLDDEHAVMRHDRPAALADDVGCGTFSALQTSAM
jgi:hypothetical protein